MKLAEGPACAAGLHEPGNSWSCTDFAAFYMYGTTDGQLASTIVETQWQCDPAAIRSSPNCDADCQTNPGYLQLVCPDTCNTYQPEDSAPSLGPAPTDDIVSEPSGSVLSAQDCVESTADAATCTECGQELYTLTTAANGGAACTGSSTPCTHGQGSASCPPLAPANSCSAADISTMESWCPDNYDTVPARPYCARPWPAVIITDGCRLCYTSVTGRDPDDDPPIPPSERLDWRNWITSNRMATGLCGPAAATVTFSSTATYERFEGLTPGPPWTDDAVIAVIEGLVGRASD